MSHLSAPRSLGITNNETSAHQDSDCVHSAKKRASEGLGPDLLIQMKFLSEDIS